MDVREKGIKEFYPSKAANHRTRKYCRQGSSLYKSFDSQSSAHTVSPVAKKVRMPHVVPYRLAHEVSLETEKADRRYPASVLGERFPKAADFKHL
jgi:hypothetical protein